ncbi:hypothetical protein pb186bvf_013639 [Paramecium bursaria]
MSYVYPYRSRAYYSPSRSYVQTPYWSSPYKTYTTPVSPSSWVERIPVEQRYTEYIPEHRVEYRPVERRYTDYVEVEHVRDYVPVPRYERRTEYVPVERLEERLDYYPVERSQVIRTPERLGYSRVSRLSYPSRYY